MAATNVTIEVQEYLEKHKINPLFEDMRAKLIKNLPSDPVNYLINVLKAVQEKKKRPLSTRDSASSSRIEVSGKSVKPVAAEKLAKSSDNVRPHTTSTPKRLPSNSSATTRSGSKLKAPATPTTPKVASATTPKAAAKDAPRSSKDTPRPTRTSTPRTAKAGTVSGRPIRPSTAPANGQTKTARGTRSQPSSSASKVVSRSTTSKNGPTKSSPAKTTPSKPTTGTAKRVFKPNTPNTASTTKTTNTTTTSTAVASTTATTASTNTTNTITSTITSSSISDAGAITVTIATTETVKTSEVETIDEFFGEKKKSSSKQLLDLEEKETAELEDKATKLSADEVAELEGKEKPLVDEDKELATEKDQPSSEETEMVSTETPNEDTTIIDTYLQKKKSQNKDARTDHLESLQEMILTDKKSDDHGNHDNAEDDDGNGEQPVGLLEDIEVLKEEEGVTGTTDSQDGQTEEVVKKLSVTEDSTLTAGDTAPITAEEDFESASQINAPNDFPSCDTSTTVTEQSSSDSQKPSNYDDGDSTTASMATTAPSKDEWEGLTQAQPPVIDDSESEVQLPKVPLSGKSWTPPPTNDEPDDPSTAAQQWAT